MLRYTDEERDDVLVAVGGDDTRATGACAQIARGCVALLIGIPKALVFLCFCFVLIFFGFVPAS